MSRKNVVDVRKRVPMTQIWLAIPLGLVTGALLGLLGAGGSVLTVPALVYLLGQPVGAATTASLLIVSANAAVGAAENARRGSVDLRLAAGFGLTSVSGAVLGSYLSRFASGETVLALLALVMIGAAWSLWRGRPEQAGSVRERRTRIALTASLGLLVGVMTGFFGVGGGFLIVPALVLLLAVPLRLAIGTSLLIITVTALAGLVGHLAGGGISWPLTLAFGGAGVVGVYLGARGGRSMSTGRLSHAFAAMLVIVAVVLLVKNGAALVG